MISSVAHVQASQEQIRLPLNRISEAWLKGDPNQIPAALDDCFTDEAIIKGPDLTTVAKGKTACVKSYTDFLLQASLRDCVLFNYEIQLVDNMAVATYSWKIIYEMNRE